MSSRRRFETCSPVGPGLPTTCFLDRSGDRGFELGLACFIFLSILLCFGDPLNFGDDASRTLRFQGRDTAGDEIERALKSARRFSFLDGPLAVGALAESFEATGALRARVRSGESTIMLEEFPSDMEVSQIRSLVGVGENRGLRMPAGAGTIAVERRP